MKASKESCVRRFILLLLGSSMLVGCHHTDRLTLIPQTTATQRLNDFWLLNGVPYATILVRNESTGACDFEIEISEYNFLTPAPAKIEALQTLPLKVTPKTIPTASADLPELRMRARWGDNPNDAGRSEYSAFLGWNGATTATERTFQLDRPDSTNPTIFKRVFNQGPLITWGQIAEVANPTDRDIRVFIIRKVNGIVVDSATSCAAPSWFPLGPFAKATATEIGIPATLFGADLNSGATVTVCVPNAPAFPDKFPLIIRTR